MIKITLKRFGKRVLLHVTRVISAGWCAEWLLGGASHHPATQPRGLKHVGAKNTKTKVQIVISCAFNNKKLVHFVGIIIV
jgi:hypothetical protein